MSGLLALFCPRSNPGIQHYTQDQDQDVADLLQEMRELRHTINDLSQNLINQGEQITDIQDKLSKKTPTDLSSTKVLHQSKVEHDRYMDMRETVGNVTGTVGTMGFFGSIFVGLGIGLSPVAPYFLGSLGLMYFTRQIYPKQPREREIDAYINGKSRPFALEIYGKDKSELNRDQAVNEIKFLNDIKENIYKYLSNENEQPWNRSPVLLSFYIGGSKDKEIESMKKVFNINQEGAEKLRKELEESVRKPLNEYSERCLRFAEAQDSALY